MQTTHWLSYQSSPRAKIFRRDQAGVLDLDGMKRIMRYNDWRKDPVSWGGGCIYSVMCQPWAAALGHGGGSYLAPPSLLASRAVVRPWTTSSCT